MLCNMIISGQVKFWLWPFEVNLYMLRFVSTGHDGAQLPILLLNLLLGIEIYSPRTILLNNNFFYFGNLWKSGA